MIPSDGRHILILDSRELRALVPTADGPEYRREAIAYWELQPGRATEALLRCTAWPTVSHMGRTYLVGDAVRELDQALGFPGQAIFPLDGGHLLGEPAPSIVRALIHRILDPRLSDPPAFVLLLPAERPPYAREVLRALAERPEDEPAPPLEFLSVIELCNRRGPADDRLQWSWVVGDGAVSIGSRGRGAGKEAHLAPGLSALEKRVGGAPASWDAARGVWMRDLLEGILAKTLALSREAWTSANPPPMSLEIVAPRAHHDEIQVSLPAVLENYRLPVAEIRLRSYPEFLERIPGQGSHLSAVSGTRPQAIRPRCRPTF